MDTVLSLVMFAGVAMVAGAAWLWRRGAAPRQVWLMLLAAVVMFVNVLIWTIPDGGGTAPIDRATSK